MRQMLAHFRVSEKSNKKKTTAKKSLKEEKKITNWMIFIAGDAIYIATLNPKRPYLSLSVSVC